MLPFLDSNIIIYAFSNDWRKQKAIDISISGSIISTQTLNEVTNVLRKKMADLPLDLILQEIERLQTNFQLTIVTAATINFAIKLGGRYMYSHFDCLMLASAIEADCSIIYTEDMRHDHILEEGLHIINPFK